LNGLESKLLFCCIVERWTPSLSCQSPGSNYCLYSKEEGPLKVAGPNSRESETSRISRVWPLDWSWTVGLHVHSGQDMAGARLRSFHRPTLIDAHCIRVRRSVAVGRPHETMTSSIIVHIPRRKTNDDRLTSSVAKLNQRKAAPWVRFLCNSCRAYT